MTKKRVFHSELAYIFGLLILALGTAFMEKADFGVSMVVAPAYLIHLKVSESLPFFSFGMAEYSLQAVVIVLMMILLKKVKLSYFFSFVTAVIYGFMLDGSMAVLSSLSQSSFFANLVFYIIGMLLCSIGVSLLFHTYISPEAYELFVKEVSSKYRMDIHRFKTAYDCTSCVLAIGLSFIFFGLWHFEGVKFGTIFCALINGYLISLCTKLLESQFDFQDRFPLKKYF